MATGNTLFDITPAQFFPENNIAAQGEPGLMYNGLARGVAYPGGVNSGAVCIKRLPATASLSTGATVVLLISDDPNNTLAGKSVVLGVSFAAMGTAGNYYAPTTTGLGTEATATVIMPPTAGQTLSVSIAVLVANMPGLAASTFGMLRVRRLGANASDTGGTGVMLLLAASVFDT